MKTLAIIKGVRFGTDATGRLGLSFGAYVAEGVGAPQFLTPFAALNVIERYGVSDVSQLEGRPCWVVLDPPSCVFVAPALI